MDDLLERALDRQVARSRRRGTRRHRPARRSGTAGRAPTQTHADELELGLRVVDGRGARRRRLHRRRRASWRANGPSAATRAPLVDPLPAGTVLLAAQGRDVVALGSNGEQLATMIHAQRGAVVDAQITRDHRWLWYLSVAGQCAGDGLRRGRARRHRRSVVDGHRARGELRHQPGRAPTCTLGVWRRRARRVRTRKSRRRSRPSTFGPKRALGPRSRARMRVRWSGDGRSLIGRHCSNATLQGRHVGAARRRPAQLGPAGRRGSVRL